MFINILIKLGRMNFYKVVSILSEMLNYKFLFCMYICVLTYMFIYMLNLKKKMRKGWGFFLDNRKMMVRV